MEISTKAKTAPQTDLEKAIHALAAALKTRDLVQAEPALKTAEKLAPEDVRVIHLKGLYLFHAKKLREAAKLIYKASEMRPKDAPIRHNLAAVLISLGEFKAAEQYLIQALTLQPNYAEAYHTLAPIHDFTDNDPMLRQMENFTRNRKFSKVDGSFICFALAKAYDDIKAPDKAWPVLEQGNRLMDSTHDAAAEAAAVDQTIALFTKDFIAERGRYGHPTEAPIFVVGLPRSGTTLLESVLSEHPQVFGAGELTAISGVALKLVEEFAPDTPFYERITVAKHVPESHVYAAALGYLDHARADAKGWFDYFVDKMPDNSFQLGFIKCLLPKARIIHIMRNPMDTLLSIYFQRFTALRYGFRPEDIVAHYHDYQRMMAHWRDVLGDDLIELRYENLVQDKDFAQSYLFDRLGLTQDTAHVANTRSRDEQSTASRYQVKQPVYTSSREKWRRYEAHMGAFLEGIGGEDALEAEIAAQEARCALKAASKT